MGVVLTSLADLHAAISACAKLEQHTALEQRIDGLETVANESAEKCASLDILSKESAEKYERMHEQRDECMTRLETRLEYAEALLGDSALQHTDEIQSAHADLADLHA